MGVDIKHPYLDPHFLANVEIHIDTVPADGTSLGREMPHLP